MNIGSKVKEERLKKEWTQEQVAKLLNVSRSAVSSWEVGRNYPDLITLVAISDLFDISLDKLLREDTEMTKKVTKKIKMNKYYKGILIVLSILAIFYIGFNRYLLSVEKKYRNNLDKNGWEMYQPEDLSIPQSFNEYTLKENDISYYTNIMPTGFIGVPLSEQKLKIITKKDKLVMRIQDSDNMEILINKDNDSSVKHNSKLKVNKELKILEDNTTTSEKANQFNKEYIQENKKDYQEMMSDTLKKIDNIKK